MLLKLLHSNPSTRPSAEDALRWISSSYDNSGEEEEEEKLNLKSSSPILPPGLKKVANVKKMRQRHKTPPRKALQAMKKKSPEDDRGDEGHGCCVQ